MLQIFFFSVYKNSHFSCYDFGTEYNDSSVIAKLILKDYVMLELLREM